MIDKYPYTDLHQLNLDWIVNAILDVTSAAKISFDPAGTDLTSTNVQSAIAEVMNDFVSRAVLSFNGRGGEVTPRTGDYTAAQITYLQGTVASALTEALEKAGVKSFNGRDGAVVPASGDYAANQVSFNNALTSLVSTTVQDALVEINSRISDPEASSVSYDNTESHLQAVNVQQAIDAIAGSILASGVASFNGRTGAVIPANNDYTANLISYSNETSGLMATSVQSAIDELASGSPTTITLNFTLHGAKNDNITIYDSNGAELGICIFNNSTDGTCSVVVERALLGTEFSFMSNVSYAENNTDHFSVRAVITTAENDITVRPSGKVLYWYGYINPEYPASATASGITYNTNHMTISGQYTPEAIDTTGYSKIHSRLQLVSDSNWALIYATSSNSSSVFGPVDVANASDSEFYFASSVSEPVTRSATIRNIYQDAETKIRLYCASGRTGNYYSVWLTEN